MLCPCLRYFLPSRPIIFCFVIINIIIKRMFYYNILLWSGLLMLLCIHWREFNIAVLRKMYQAFILRLYSLKELEGTQEKHNLHFFWFFFLGTTSVSLHFLMLISESSVSGSLASCSTFLPLFFSNGCANLKNSLVVPRKARLHVRQSN